MNLWPVITILLLFGIAAPEDDWWSDYRRGLWFTCLIGGFLLAPIAPPLGVLMLIVGVVCVLGQLGGLAMELTKWSGKQIDSLPDLFPPQLPELPPSPPVPTKEELLKEAKRRRQRCLDLITSAGMSDEDARDFRNDVEDAYRYWVEQIVKG
jgi:hypothetical protein